MNIITVIEGLMKLSRCLGSNIRLIDRTDRLMREPKNSTGGKQQHCGRNQHPIL